MRSLRAPVAAQAVIGRARRRVACQPRAGRGASRWRRRSTPLRVLVATELVVAVRALRLGGREPPGAGTRVALRRGVRPRRRSAPTGRCTRTSSRRSRCSQRALKGTARCGGRRAMSRPCSPPAPTSRSRRAARVAWEGEGVEIAAEALARMDACARVLRGARARARRRRPGRADLRRHHRSRRRRGGGARRRAARRAGRPRCGRRWPSASRCRERVVRGIVLARLANMLDGHAAARAEVAQAVAAMLDQDALARRPRRRATAAPARSSPSDRSSRELSERIELSHKERMALINGSPCAAALVADVALAARERLILAEQVFALSAEVVGAPLEAYGADLEALWGDEHETAALAIAARAPGRGRRAPAPPGGGQLPHPAAGARRRAARARRGRACGERRAARRSPTTRSTSRPTSAGRSARSSRPAATTTRPRRRRWTGSRWHWADLCQLAERHTDQLFQHPATAPLLSADEWTIKPVHMAQNWWAEEARSLAQPTLLSLGGLRPERHRRAAASWRGARRSRSAAAWTARSRRSPGSARRRCSRQRAAPGAAARSRSSRTCGRSSRP